MSTKKRLGELLHEAGLIDAPQLQAALGHQRRWGGLLGRALVDLRMVEERELVQVLARSLGHEVARLDGPDAASVGAATKLVPVELAQRHNVLPMAADSAALTVAMSDPTDLALIDELRFRTGRRIKVLIAGDRELAAAIGRRYGLASATTEAIALEGETTGDDVPLTEPFEGGSTEAMQASLSAERPAPEPAPGLAPAPTAPTSAHPPPAAARPIRMPFEEADALSPREAALLDALERVLSGREDATGLVKPGRLLVALARVLVRKGLVSEAELLAELDPARGPGAPL